MNLEYSAEVAKALLSIGAVSFSPDKPLTYKSGIISPIYIDNRRLPFYPQRWSVVFEGFQRLIEDAELPYDIIAGVESAGIPHSAALGFVLKRPSIFVRKQVKGHGTKKMVEGGNVKGKRVLLIEDHVTTGISSLTAVNSLRDAGAIVKDCLSITSCELPEVTQAFKAAKVHLHTLTTLSTILGQASQMNILNEDHVLVVKDWLSDAHGWAGRHGFGEAE
jgi:orotate phosphoribosyltransferase